MAKTAGGGEDDWDTMIPHYLVEKYQRGQGCLTYSLTGVQIGENGKYELLSHKEQGNYMVVGRKKHDVQKKMVINYWTKHF